MKTFLKSSRYHKAMCLLKNGINLKNEYKKNYFYLDKSRWNVELKGLKWSMFSYIVAS